MTSGLRDDVSFGDMIHVIRVPSTCTKSSHIFKNGIPKNRLCSEVSCQIHTGRNKHAQDPDFPPHPATLTALAPTLVPNPQLGRPNPGEADVNPHAWFMGINHGHPKIQ